MVISEGGYYLLVNESGCPAEQVPEAQNPIVAHQSHTVCVRRAGLLW